MAQRRQHGITKWNRRKSTRKAQLFIALNLSRINSRTAKSPSLESKTMKKPSKRVHNPPADRSGRANDIAKWKKSGAGKATLANLDKSANRLKNLGAYGHAKKK
jgi:hypothetical protein